jgi:hypothetical protein
VIRKQPTFIAASLLALGFALAQTSPTDPRSGQITITPPPSQKVITGAPDRFTGSVRVRSFFDAKSPARSTGGEVAFQPRARSAWHTHPLGRVLIVTHGGLGAAMGQSGSGDAQGGCGVDSAWGEALARGDADDLCDAHRIPGRTERSERHVDGEGHRRAVQARQVTGYELAGNQHGCRQ